MNLTDAITKNNVGPSSSQTHVNKTDCSDISRGLVWDQLRGEACLGMSCPLTCLFVVISYNNYRSKINMEDPSDSLIWMNHWVRMMWAQVESLFPGAGNAAHTDLHKYLDSLRQIYKHKRTH